MSCSDNIEEAFLDAARFGDLNTIKELWLQRDSQVLETTDEFQNSALHLAAANGHLAIVEFLIKQQVNVNAKNDSGNTPLHWAAWLGQLQVVEYLIKHGADVSLKNEFERTPLEEAVDKGYSSIVSLLEKELESQSKTDTSWISKDN
eukprot:jgi/Galph1/5690/GphlegSOOS_G4405.1